MPSLSDWKVPPNDQPRPADYAFDLEVAMGAVVGLRATIPEDAFTAQMLGTERAGNGVVIRDSGLVLTIGYLITEAETIWLSPGVGPPVQGHALAYDQETGFGLVQALARLNAPALPIGSSAKARLDDRVIVAGAGGRQRSVAARIVAKEEFAGYWEYVLDEAIFTAPAHPNWGGTAMIGASGELLGIGSLKLEQEQDGGLELRRETASSHLNMIVPIDLLKPILDNLLRYGRPTAPPVARILCGQDRGPDRCDRACRSGAGATCRTTYRRRGAGHRRWGGSQSCRDVPAHMVARPGRGENSHHVGS